jgi:hypothetical protein
LTSVDATDCMIPRVKGQGKAFNSHKFDGPGLRYEIAVCILTGWIVWVMGPFLVVIGLTFQFFALL